jgi:hypothetical protein
LTVSVKASDTDSKIEDEDSNVSLNELKNSSLLVQLSVILVTVALVTAVIGLVVFVRFYLYHKMPQFIKNIILSLQDSLMFNSVLRTLMQTYLATAINTSIAIEKVSLDHKMNSAITIATMCYLILFPYIGYKLLR